MASKKKHTSKKKSKKKLLAKATKLAQTLDTYIPKKPTASALSNIQLPDTRIVVAVAETATWNKYESISVQSNLSLTTNRVPMRYKIPCGMAAAQAAHAVSKLKMLYINNLGRELFEQDGWANHIDGMIQQGITTIVVKARDSEELEHIRHLAREQNLLNVAFYDTNDEKYSYNAKVLTAVAIGPISKAFLRGITDYLPLWQCGCDPVK